MLKIVVPGVEMYDEETEKFFEIPSVDLELEHSLVSLSKWEEEFEKPFLSPGDKELDEVIGYVRCMTLTPDVPPEVFLRLSTENFEAINTYLNRAMSATRVSEIPGVTPSREIITAELIYYWMTVFNIPLEWENRHLNKLFMHIKVCGAKQSKPKKMGKAEAAERQRQLNAQRRQALGSKG